MAFFENNNSNNNHTEFNLIKIVLPTFTKRQKPNFDKSGFGFKEILMLALTMIVCVPLKFYLNEIIAFLVDDFIRG